jgi:hypothetical protein
MWDEFVRAITVRRRDLVATCCSTASSGDQRAAAAERLDELGLLMKSNQLRHLMGAPLLKESGAAAEEEIPPEQRFTHDGGY